MWWKALIGAAVLLYAYTKRKKEITPHEVRKIVYETHVKYCKEMGLGEIPCYILDGNPDMNIKFKEGIPKEFRVILATSICREDGEMFVNYYLNNYMQSIENLKVHDLEDVEFMADMNVRHELYHIRQYKWLFEHGGFEAVQRAIQENDNSTYGTGALDNGACAYELNKIEQDFGKELGKFVLA